MGSVAKNNLIAQWAFDTRPVLLRFHLWLEDVEVERSQDEPVSAHTFAPRGITRCLAMTAAATSLGTRLFGHYGEAAGADKQRFNQVKKSADAVSAYVMSEGLWHLTRQLPENHAVMISLGEGLMPKAGETPEMGANPLLGFGRVYARPQVAQVVDAAVRRLLNDKAFDFNSFHTYLRRQGITVWGAAVDTLENTTRFAEGQPTGPMTILHLFDAPLVVARPYESYMGCLTVPREVARAAEERAVLLDYCTPRARLVEAIEHAYPGIERGHIHVWTLSGRSRVGRMARLWGEWEALGAHLVEDGWRAPSGLGVFTDSGTYAPTFLVGSWQDADGKSHVFLIDGYAASAEAMQAASLAEALSVECTMAPFSPKFERPHDDEYKLMRLSPDAPDFAASLAKVFGVDAIDEGRLALYAAAIRQARESNIPLDKRVLRADDLLPDKGWGVLACTGYMCDDPYTGAPGVERLSDDRYRVTTRLLTRNAHSKVTFTFRLLDGLEPSRLVFSPLLVRFLSGVEPNRRAVKVSDSGRIRNELQTMFSQALAYDGDRIRVHFGRIEESVMPREDQARIRTVLEWYKANHSVWFSWLDLAD